MVNILICDDDAYDLSLLEQKINVFMEQSKREYQLMQVNSGEKVIEKLTSDELRIDILILDIDMKNMDGLQVAKSLRMVLNMEFILIFVTNHAEYVFESLQYEPFRYIRKQCIDKELPLALKASIERIEIINGKYIYVDYRNGKVKLELKKVMYFELENRIMRAYMENGEEVLFQSSMKSLEQKLRSVNANFVKVHSGCLVNPYYVETIGAGEVKLQKGKCILVSRRNYKSVKEQIYFYWGELM